MRREIVFIKDGKITTGSDRVRRGIETSKDGSYVWTLKSEKSKASSRMFGYLFGYLYPAVLFEMGQDPSVEALNELDRELKMRFGPAIPKRKYEMRREFGLSGKPFLKVTDSVVPKSKADYTVEEMQNYWMAIQRIAAEMWDVALKDPDSNWRDGWEQAAEKRVAPVGYGQGRATRPPGGPPDPNLKICYHNCGHGDCRRCDAKCEPDQSGGGYDNQVSNL